MSARAQTESGGGRALVETSHDLPLVSLSIGTKTGAAYDPAGQEGLTRLTGRLMRRTGGGRDAQEIDEQIDALGGSVSVDVSASATVFHGTVIRRSLEPFLALIGDVMARPSLDVTELGRLTRETQAELVETLDDDRGLCRRWFRKKLFEGHAYSRPVGGTTETLNRITESDVRSCAGRLTVREGQVVAFAGDIEPGEAERRATELTSILPSGTPLAESIPDPKVRAGRHLIVVDKPERTQTQILIGGLGTHPRDPDHTALLVGNTIFGGTFTARLTNEVRSKRGWSYGAYSNLPVDRKRQAFSMWTFPKAEDAAPCIALELELLEELREKGVTKKELAWAKKYLARSHAFAVDTPSKRVGLTLDAALYDLPEGYYEQYLERIAAVTLAEVNLALTQRLPRDDLLIVVVGSASAIQSPIEQAIPRLADTEVVRFDVEV